MKRICCFASAIFLAFGNSTAMYAADGIRVGYEEDYGVLMSSSIHSYPGYGYEYLNKIVEYTLDDYYIDFIPCTLDEGLYLLETGLLDIFAPVPRISSWEDQYLFSQESFGREVRFLASNKKDYIPTGDTQELEGKTIVVQLLDPMLESLKTFFLEEGVSAEIIETEIRNYGELVETTSYDYIFASSLWMVDNLHFAFPISTHETHLMALPHMTYLMDDLNQAMNTVDMTDYMYQERLFLKYFSETYDVRDQLLKSDYELMKLKSTYYVGIHDFDSPFAHRDDDGVFTGIYPEILNRLADEFSVEFEFVVFEDVGSSQLSNKVDFTIHSIQNPVGLQESNPLFSFPFQLVRTPSFSGHEEDLVIGTLDYYDLTLDDINHVISGENLFLGKTPEELLLALEHGAVDVLFLAEYSVEHLDFEGLEVVVQDVPFHYTPVISYETGFSSDKISAMNKVISQLDELEMEFLLQKYLIPQEKDVSFLEYLKKSPIFLQSGFLLLAVGCLFGLIQERHGKRKAIISLQVDDATGLSTEKYFREKAQEIILGNPGKYGMISCEIERFHGYQELYDKKNTDALLKECAKFIQSFTPVLSCHSGDGLFLFLMDIEEFKKNIQEHLSKDSEIVDLCSKHLTGNQNIALTFGICGTNINDDVADLITFAQYAQFWGVGFEHNNVYEFDAEMRENQKTSHDILSKVENAFTHQEFLLYYQPMMDMRTKELIGIEALVRWKRPDKLLVAREFVPLLEEHGFAPSLDFYVLEQACKFLVKQGNEPFPTLWVNVSVQTLLTTDFILKLEELVQKYSIQKGSLGFEVKESIFVEYCDILLEKMNQLTVLGIPLSMDDFGAEMGSYSVWSEAPITTLKLDREFLLKCKNEKKAEESMKYMLQQGRNASIEILVECVETVDESLFLKKLGCSFGQGKFFAEPKGEEQFLLELKSMKKKRASKSVASPESSVPSEVKKNVQTIVENKSDGPLTTTEGISSEEENKSENTPHSSGELPKERKQSTPLSSKNKGTTAGREEDSSLFSPLEEFEP